MDVFRGVCTKYFEMNVQSEEISLQSFIRIREDYLPHKVM